MIAALPNSPISLLRAMAAGVDPVGYFRRRATDTAPVTLNFPGLGRVDFFGTPEAAREILTMPPAASRAPRPNPIEPVVGSGSLILLSGAEHRRERALLTPAFHGERVKNYVDLIAAAAAEEVATLRPGDRIAVRELSIAITLHIAIRVIFGVAEDHRRNRYAEAVTALMRANTTSLMLVPALRRQLGGRGPWARLLQLRDDLDRLLSEDMAARTDLGPAGNDMLDLLLTAEDVDGSRHTTAELHDQLRTLLAAGHETTATALTWTLYHICRDGDIHQRVQDELADCVDPPDIAALPYLNAVIKEALRMHPPVPIVLRRLTEPRSLGGVPFQADDVVGIALYALHFNPAVWPDPDRFDPTRFLDGRPSPFEYAPFGGGHRRCIGASFAQSELAIATGTILKELDLQMTSAELHRSPPRSTAAGIAVAPHREIYLDVRGRVATV